MTITEMLSSVWEALTVQPLQDWHEGDVVAVSWGREDKRRLPMIVFNIRADQEDRTHIQSILPAYVTIHCVASTHADAMEKLEWSIGYLKNKLCGAEVAAIDDGYDHELKGYVATGVIRQPVSISTPPSLNP